MIAWGSSERFSAHHTYWWLRAVFERFGWSIGSLPVVNLALRKLGHFCVYGTLSVLLFLAWRESLLPFPRRLHWTPRLLLLSLGGVLLVASLDEFHQSFVPGRTGVPRDVLLDVVGALFTQMLLLAALYGRRSQPTA